MDQTGEKASGPSRARLQKSAELLGARRHELDEYRQILREVVLGSIFGLTGTGGKAWAEPNPIAFIIWQLVRSGIHLHRTMSQSPACATDRRTQTKTPGSRRGFSFLRS